MREAAAHVRERSGPVLVHASVIRPYSHSLSDDEKLYKTPAEREAEARRDPLVRMRQFLKSEGLASDEDFADILASVCGRFSRCSTIRSRPSAARTSGTS
jgi:2-oxoisovalerate dehydrogenase E1 component